MKKITVLAIISLLTCNVLQAQWATVAKNNVGVFHNIYFINSKLGFAAGEDVGKGVIFKTTDGGITWSKAYQTAHSLQWIYDIYFTNANNGFAVGERDTIFKTVDGGTSWTIQTVPNVYRLNSIFFPTTSIGYAVGDGSPNGPIYKTTDGGTTWNAQTSNASNALNDVFFTDANNGYALGDHDILKTINGGTTWTNVSYSGDNFGHTSIHCTDANTCYVGGVTLLKTTNGGTSWTKYSQLPITDSVYYFSSLFFTDANTGYASGARVDTVNVKGYGVVFKTIDAGNSWHLQTSKNDNPDLTSNSLDGIYFPTADTGFSAGNKGLVVKTVNGGGAITAIENNLVHENNELLVYPNPGNGAFTVMTESHSRLRVVNMLGEKIYETITTSGKTLLDMGSFPKGIYFVQVNNGKDMTMKKMIIQ